MDYEEQLALAPCDLVYTRPTRYDGSGFSVQLSHFAPADLDLLTRVYRVMRRGHGLWLHLRDATRTGAPLPIDLLRRHILRELRDRNFLLLLRELGAATYALGTPGPGGIVELSTTNPGIILCRFGAGGAQE